MIHTGDHAWADPGQEPFNRAVVAHPEPPDRDANGSGGTCRSV